MLSQDTQFANMVHSYTESYGKSPSAYVFRSFREAARKLANPCSSNNVEVLRDQFSEKELEALTAVYADLGYIYRDESIKPLNPDFMVEPVETRVRKYILKT